MKVGALRLLRLLLLLVLVAAGFALIGLLVARGVDGMAGIPLVVALFALGGIHLSEKRIKALQDHIAREEANWIGAELTVPLRMWRPLAILVLASLMFVVGLFALIGPSSTARPAWPYGVLVALSGWVVLLSCGTLVRSLAAGYAARVDASGAHFAGWGTIPWRNVHGAALFVAEHRGIRVVQLQLLVSDLKRLAPADLVTLLFGPVRRLFGWTNVLMLPCSTMATHEKRIEAAVRHLAKRHAPRFDEHWRPGMQMIRALEAADRENDRRVAMEELHRADATLRDAIGKTRDENDPAFRSAKRRLDSALATVEAQGKADMAALMKATADTKRLARQTHWIGWASAVAVVAVIAGKLYWSYLRA